MKYNTITCLLGATALLSITTPALADKSDKLAVSKLHDRIVAVRAEPGVAQNGSAELDRAEATLKPLLENLKDNDIKEVESITGEVDALIDTARARAKSAAIKSEIAGLEAARGNRINAAEVATAQAQSETNKLRAEMTSNEATRVATAKTNAAEASQLRSQLSEYQMTQTPRGATLVLSDVVFASGGSDLKPGAIERLRPLTGYLQTNNTVRVQIDGHTDGQGTNAANQALSDRRAKAVGAMLIGTGIDGARIETIGHGESEPVADNRTAAGRQQNRRVELTLVGQQLSSLQPK
jgi:outer membrane protein OmpA-like peptidoglycan-associated protein